MKKKIVLLFFEILILLTISSCQKTNELISLQNYFNEDLLNWKKTFANFKLEDFRKVNEVNFENIKSGEINDLSKFYEIHKPILTFSIDKTKFIDIYSSQFGLIKENGKIISNKDVDQEISLVDLNAKTWNRILFLGSYSWIDEVLWIDNNKFILVGIEENNLGKSQPIIYIGNNNKKTLLIFKNQNKECLQNGNVYYSDKLKNIKIE